MLINTFLDTEDFVHLYYTEDEPVPPQGCGAGARMASKYPRPPSPPEYTQVPPASRGEMSEAVRWSEAAPHRVRAADLYPRARTHYDEPGLEPGFSTICGEFVQWVGRTADGGTIAMSNYRLHAQPRRRNGPGASVPLRLIDAVEIRDLLHLVVLCKHGRTLRCTFATGEQCVEWWRRLNTALAPVSSVQETFAAAYAAWAKEQPPASVHRALMKASHSPQRHWFGPEVERLGFTIKGAWRVSAANAEYKLCPSYPPLLVVPATIGDEDLDSVARFRAMRRVPAVVWRHRGNGAVIARSSQPEVGWLGWRSSEDERLLAAFVSACNADRGLQPTTNKQTKLLIVDARSYASAVTNRARGGGCECQQYYPNADIQFMCLPNIHHVRRSFQQMRALVAEPSDQTNWHSNLERTLWLQYVSGVLRAASVVARAVLAGRPVLVHCSDGWDRTPQIVAAAQLILDPYYRTVEGFRVLVEREWLDFGHKFADRCGHAAAAEEPNERSPVFLQWLDCVHQLLLQYPCSFQFNEAYLIKLATHVHSCMFGTFLCNTTRERVEARVPETTAQVWHLLRAPAYRNHLYSPHQLDQVLWVECGVRHIRVWWAMFYGGERDEDDQADPPPPKPTPLNGLTMTKTRSCDNLLSEGEKRTTQRRSSDPSLTADVMKLSMVVNKDMERSALTDSCVDDLPVLPATCDPADPNDQVDGLHPDHFQGSPRPHDLVSGSSSLERELAATDLTDKVITHTDQVIEHTDEVEKHDSDSTQTAESINGDTTDTGDMVESVVRAERSPESSALLVGSPEEPAVFVCDTFGEIVAIAEAAREARDSARTRNISITWRSISESSNQSSTGFDIERAEPSNPEPAPKPLGTSNLSVVNNRNSTERDPANHNGATHELTNHNRPVNGVNGVDAVTTKFLEVELNGGTSSSVSSESECEAISVGGVPAHTAGHRARGGSQLTLCPASPRRVGCCHCSHTTSLTSGIETSGESGASSEVCWCGVCSLGAGAEARCVCGAGAGAMAGAGGRDPLDGLPAEPDALQDRLHQIILYQKKVVEELSGQLRSAREALRRATPPPQPRASPSAPSPTQMTSSSGGGRSSSSGSEVDGEPEPGLDPSEVELGVEARGVHWLPDSAASRCQHCRNHFWLARRRHHCRRCGGIFCGSCSEVSSWGDCGGGAVRMCRRCRALR